MDMASLKKSIKSPTVLFVVGALAVGAVGSKMLWTDAPALKVPTASATPKPSANATTPPRATSAVTVNVASSSQSNRPQTAAPSRPGVAVAVATNPNVTPIAVASPAAAEPAQPRQQQVTVSEEEEAPVAARAPRASMAGSKRNQPSEVDASSDTEGLFLISALKQAPANEAPAVAPAAETKQAIATNASTVSVGEVTNSALGERVVTTSSATPASGAATENLGPVFVDDTNSYYMRFPSAWSIRRFDGEPWVVECGDGKNALISIGFSAFPAEYTADDISLDWVARRIKKRSDTTLNAQGYATIMNRKAVWSKSTGPMQMGGSQVKVVRTTYILPLGDGRVAEIRIAAAPEQYEKIAGLMKNAVSTFRLVPKRGPETTVARTE